MKKVTTFLMLVALFAGNAAQAQQSNNSGNMMGRGASSGTTMASDSTGMAWGIGLGALAVVGTVVGVVAATATSNNNTFNH